MIGAVFCRAHRRSEQIEVAIPLNLKLIREDSGVDRGLALGTWDEQALVLAHRNFQADGCSGGLELSESIAYGIGGACEDAVVQVREDEVKAVTGVICLKVGEDWLERQGKKEWAKWVSLLNARL